MPARETWARWRRFAHRAAQVQSYIVLGILYSVAILPMALVRMLTPGADRRREVHWREREPSAGNLASARRQS